MEIDEKLDKMIQIKDHINRIYLESDDQNGTNAHIAMALDHIVDILAVLVKE